MENIENKVTVVDAIMGAGKSSWIIQHMSEPNPAKNYLYITPFLDEVERIIKSVKIPVKQPKNLGKSKEDDLCQLVQRQDDIASTHQLLRNVSDETIELIKENQYTLILDEVMEVITPLEVKKDTVKILKDADCITVDEQGFVHWNPEKTDYNPDKLINDIKDYALNHRLVCVDDTFLLWQVPPQLFLAFEEIYVLTYMFEASILYYYFRLYGIAYNKKSIGYENGKYYLKEYSEPDTSIYQELIEIYDGHLNNTFVKRSGLSKNWFKSTASKEDIKKLKDNVYNYLHNMCKANKNEIMWTTFKEAAPKLSRAGYVYRDVEKYPDKKNRISFVPCNARATNAHADRYVLAYCVNRFMNPAIEKFFGAHGIKVDEDMFALAEMVQWIWRSRIRKGMPIKIYIPSQRSRNLLCRWITALPLEDDCKKVS